MRQINFKGLDWYVLEETDEITRLLLKNVLTEEQIKKYCDDDKYRDGKKVRHSFDLYPPFYWNKSYIKNKILPNFKKDLELPTRNCLITLLTKEEVELLPDEVRNCNNWYWTKSDATESDDKIACAWYVNSYGNVGNPILTNPFSVRPVLSLATHLITSENTRQMTCSEELDIIPLTFQDGHNQVEINEYLRTTLNQLIKEITKLKGEKNE